MICPVSVLSNERGGFRSETQAPEIVVSDEQHDMTDLFASFQFFLIIKPKVSGHGVWGVNQTPRTCPSIFPITWLVREYRYFWKGLSIGDRNRWNGYHSLGALHARDDEGLNVEMSTAEEMADTVALGKCQCDISRWGMPV